MNLTKKDSSFFGRFKNRKIIILIVTLLVIIITGTAVYFDRIAPFRATVISVDDSTLSMGVFLRRAGMTDKDPMSLLRIMADELIIKLEAPYPPYEVDVTDSDLEIFLRKVAADKSESLNDDVYREWYRQQLNESNMPEKEFREYLRTRLLVDRFTEHLAGKVPTVAEQVHLYMFPVNGMETAKKAKARIESGESFSVVAAELSSDAGMRVTGGDMGWQARKGLLPQIGSIVFDELSIGEVSDPYYIEGDIFALIMISEKESSRILDDLARSRIQARVLDDWLTEAQSRHDTGFYGFRGGYDAGTDTWVRWQLNKNKPAGNND